MRFAGDVFSVFQRSLDCLFASVLKDSLQFPSSLVTLACWSQLHCNQVYQWESCDVKQPAWGNLQVAGHDKATTLTLNIKILEPCIRRFVCCQAMYSLARACCFSSAGYQWSGKEDECFCAMYFRMAMLQKNKSKQKNQPQDSWNLWLRNDEVWGI